MRAFKDCFINDSVRLTWEQLDSETKAHCLRVGQTAFEFALYLGDRTVDPWMMRMAGVWHDIGKQTTPKEVLQFPGKLNDADFAIMKQHAQNGLQFAHCWNHDVRISEMVAHHHERYDGKGYPIGVPSHQLSIEVRILSVIDVYDALVSDRVYRKGMTEQKVLQIIWESAGTQLDPEFARLFIAWIEQRHATIAA